MRLYYLKYKLGLVDNKTMLPVIFLKTQYRRLLMHMMLRAYSNRVSQGYLLV